jgi:putative DNA-invertase from lambdoid prophage Rac
MCVITNKVVMLVGYARVSKVEQESENQILKLREYGVTRIYCDEGVSGKTDAKNRPEFKRMLEYIRSHPDPEGKGYTIVVYELSRIGRSMLDTLNTFVGLENEGFTIISLSETWTHTMDTSLRRLMVTIVSWLNQEELKRLSDRTKAGIERARAQGKQIGAPKKKIDREIINDLRSKGMSWNKIAAQLNIDPVTIYRRKLKWKELELGRGDDVQP